MSEICSHCDGSGWEAQFVKACSNCNGTGKVSTTPTKAAEKWSSERLALIQALGLTIEEVERCQILFDADATFEALVLAAKFLELKKSTNEFAQEQEADGFSLTAEEHYRLAAKYESCYWSICRQWPTQTTEAAFEEEDDAMRIGVKWKCNSSLEKWFPFAAEELKRLRAQLAENASDFKAFWADYRKTLGVSSCDLDWDYVTDIAEEVWNHRQKRLAENAVEKAKGEIPFDDEVRWILGQLCFMCRDYAKLLIASGKYEGKSRAEDEQAVAIHWMLSLYLKHGPEKWRDEGRKELDTLKASLPKPPKQSEEMK